MASDLKGLLWRLLLVANLAVAVIACCFLVAVWVAPDSMSSPPADEAGVFRLVVRSNTTLGVLTLVAAVLLLGDFLWVVHGGSPPAPPGYVNSVGPDGTVRVSRDAIEAGLRAAGEALDEVSRLRVIVDATPGLKRIFVRGQFQSPEGVSIHDAGRLLRQVLRRRFAELVRLGDGVRLEVEIEFLGFAGKLTRKPVTEPESPPAEDSADPFTGPRYPID